MVEGPAGRTEPNTSPASLTTRVKSLLGQVGLRHGFVMLGATSLANVLDYAYNVAMGRMLSADGYGVLVALQAALQIVSVSMVVISTVTARYVAGFQAGEERQRMGAFVQTALRQSAIWGLASVLLAGTLSSPIARLLQIPTAVPVLTGAVALLPLIVKPAVAGALQGQQKFTALGAVQVTQAILRLAAGMLLVRMGLDAVGAVAALPVSMVIALLLGLALLGGMVWTPTGGTHRIAAAELARYAGTTTLGIVSFAALTNMDALIVKHYFAPTDAGYYSMAVTLGKIVIFMPASFAVVLFPKSAERHVQRRDSTRLLRLSLAVTLLSCAGLTLAYWLAPDLILRTVFGAQNPFAGPVLGLVALAMSGYALINVWLNYFLSVEQTGYVYALLAALAVQFALLTLFHRSLVQVVTSVAATSAGLLACAEIWFRLTKDAGPRHSERRGIRRS